MKITRVLALLLCLTFMPVLQAQNDSASVEKAAIEAFDVIDWKLAFARMKKLSQVGFHPFIMPLIMNNSDFLELTEEQKALFREWRSKNRVPLLHTMDKIIRERNLFHKLALSPDTAEEVLITKQEEIFKLHKKVLKYQLSCRRNILDSFSPEQWDNFSFVLAENGYEID